MAKDNKGDMVVIDEALERTGFGKFNILLIIYSGVVLNTVILEAVGVSFALPVLECDLNLSHSEQGILGAVSFAGVIASSHFWGFLADTQGRKRTMQPALILGFVVTAFSSLAPNFLTFALLRFLNGLLLSACSATTFTYLGEFHCQKDRSRAIIGGSFISAAVAILIPIMAGIFINQDFEVYVPYIDIVFKPWRSYFLAFGVPGLICGLIMFFLPESPKYLLSAGKPEEAIEVLKLMHRINIGSKDPDSVYTVTTLLPDADTPMAKVKGLEKKNIFASIMQSMWQQTAPLFMREHLRKTVLSSLILYIIFFSAHGVYMWFPYILNNTMQYTEKFTEPKRICDIIKFVQSGNLTSVDEDNSTETCKMHLEISTYVHSFFLEIIYVSILMIIMFFISRTGRKPMLFINLLICGVCGILAFTIKIPLLAVYLLVIQLCCGCVISVVNAIVVVVFPTHLRGMAVCISLMSGRIGSVMGSNILGLLIETHCEIALFSPAVALIIAGALGFLLPSANHQVAKAKDLENNS
ncbi:LOW QUALITY PROTEIN: synaptic vesicle glycoprotein 2B-like [Zeugodacus cucurbitae]|uniref:LOW QUALITY PROTEIN: synaptic vesicle glycoprotein 2B-like n=1 Tax=Zeugodacus cucurbitae TaxID=28588 RepID=UPI0023D910A7|nr:LOW QUALITY PROTEIN: synaptic vesicle glycoprotein 2B-like [Zeugodacus cucurbitae]